jgi:G3E family GTPase
MSLFEHDKSAERLPVSLITGFLGSGKTTLLNRLLRHDAMKDSAVIINEYGEVSLDHLLVERIDGEVAVLASGCICCTIRSDLEETLRTLLVKRDRGEVPPFRRILVETTGLADPAPIVQLLLNNPLVSHFLRLDTVVTTVDAANAIHQLDHQYEAVKQVALADRLLITKSDLVSNTAAL